MVDFKINGEEKKFDLLRVINQEHQDNRFKGCESLLLAFSGCIYAFEKSQHSTTSIRKHRLGILLEFATINYIKYLYGKNITSLNILLLVENIKSRDKHIYYN